MNEEKKKWVCYTWQRRLLALLYPLAASVDKANISQNAKCNKIFPTLFLRSSSEECVVTEGVEDKALASEIFCKNLLE
jgi:hypothetical protein